MSPLCILKITVVDTPYRNIKQLTRNPPLQHCNYPGLHVICRIQIISKCSYKLMLN